MSSYGIVCPPSLAVETAELVVRPLDRAAGVERDGVEPSAVRGHEALAGDAPGSGTRDLDAFADGDASSRGPHGSATHRLDVVGAHARVVAQVDDEARHRSGRRVLRRRQRLDALYHLTGFVERIHPDRDRPGGSRAHVLDRPFDEDGVAVGAARLADRADGEGGGAGRLERRFRERWRDDGWRWWWRGPRAARRRDGEHGQQDRPRRPRQAATPAAAALSTASPRSVLAVRTICPGPTCHMSVVIVSPGNTTPEKRTSDDLKRAGSLSHQASSTARPAKPKVQRPCRIGRSKPAILAKSGSAWSGFMSPESR